MELCIPCPNQNETQKTLALAVKAVNGIAFSLICLLGLLGNYLVIWTILRHIKQRSATILIILNLAVANLFTLMILPVVIYSVTRTCVFQLSVQKVISYLVLSSMYVSVFSITVISILRLVAVLHTFAVQKWQRRGGVGKVLAVIWVLALLLAVSAFADAPSTTNCIHGNTFPVQHIAANFLEFFMGFLIPFIIMCCCYSYGFIKIKRMTFQTKNKAGMLILKVVVSFVLCWLPNHVNNIIIISCLLSSNEETSKALLEITQIMKSFTSIFAFASCCINPILYAFTIRNFKSGLKVSSIAKLFEEMNSSLKEKWEKTTENVEDQSNPPA
ncbi:somatostatin receptor type 2-like [Heterodontus francisci]|uniref:somatostatin receptor type 2-like n=1 Tax=Heterodontus francisci TaxID=7792 RepID=UPI00355BA08A